MKAKLKFLSVLLLASIAFGLYLWTASSGGVSQEDSVFATVRGPMDIKVIETATLKPQEQLVISNEVEGVTTILSLVEEGKRVKEGDLLVELDSSKWVDDKTGQEIIVQNSESSFVRAREDGEVAKSQAESDISKAELDYRFANEDLSQYKDGEYPNQLSEAESRIALAEEEQQRAVEKLKWSEVLSKEKYISNTELQADQLAKKRANLELELAKNSLQLLKNYTHPRQLVKLESAISQMKMALERVKRKAKASLIQSAVELKTRESEWTRQKTKLAKIEDQIKKTRITAPRDGLVVYASSTKMSWGRADALQEGQQVRERQELIYLPTNQGMKAEFNLHETQLDMISVGLKARIEVDAIANKFYTGKVMSIAPLPDATQMYFNPDLKVYPTRVYLDGKDEALRTGMNCKIEVLVESYKDVLQIPIQAVIRSGRRALVYVRQGVKSFVPKEIKVGRDNGSLILVESGLELGEEVWLTPPLEAPAEFNSDNSSRTPPLGGSIPTPSLEGAKSSSQGNTPKAVNSTSEANTLEAQNASEASAASSKKKRENLSEAEKQKMRERFQNMSPEEREKFRSSHAQKGQGVEGQQP